MGNRKTVLIDEELFCAVKEIAGMKPVLNQVVKDNERFSTAIEGLKNFKWQAIGIATSISSVLAILVSITVLIRYIGYFPK